MGTGVARAPCQRLYARLARPALLDRANRLGTVDLAGMHDRPALVPGALKSCVPLCAPESVALARALGRPGCRGIFARRRANARDLVESRCAVFRGDCQANPLVAFASRAGAGRAYRTGLRDRRQLRRAAGTACAGRKAHTFWSCRAAPAASVSHECGVCRTMVLAADAAARGPRGARR